MNELKDCAISHILISTVLILLVQTRSHAQDILCSEHDFHLHFPTKQASQFSKVATAGEKAIEAFTICVWVKTDDQDLIGILRYSDDALNDRISLEIQSGSVQLIFTLLDEQRTLDPLPLVRDGNWHGICVTWKSENGTFMVYYDGRRIQEGNNFKTGITLPPNRAFTAGVGMQDDHLYSGWLGHINAWPRVLEHPLLAVLSSKCGMERGELVSWPQFEEGVHGIDVFAGTCTSQENDLPQGLLKNFRLNGEDDVNELILKYSATFLEGRLDGHSSLYLDQTEAYAEAGSINLGPEFTFACWIKLMPSAPDYRAIVVTGQSSLTGCIFGVNGGNQLQFENWVSGYKSTYTSDSLEEKQWLHVAVSFVASVQLFFFINGFQLSPTVSSDFRWQSGNPMLLEIGRFFDQTDSKYRYFHGYLSDLLIFDRALSAVDIGKLMGRCSPCTYREWFWPSVLPLKAPTEKYRNKTCPGIGQCKQVRDWIPGDCREVLMTGNRSSGVYTINPLDEHEFQVFCDHETHGGGWTVIQRRGGNLAIDFNSTWAEYKAGFGAVDGQSEMWLGNDKIHALTTKNTELLIQLQAADGSKGYAIYSSFHVADDQTRYKLSLAEFSGNITNSFGLHNGSGFVTHDSDPGVCATTHGGGWWYRDPCGEAALLNSVVIKWTGFPLTGGPITMSEMKIRRTNGFSGDYNLEFPSGSISYVIFPNILTEFKAFSACLWLRCRTHDDDWKMTFLRYYSTNGNFSIRYHSGVKNVQFTLWPSTEKSLSKLYYPSLEDDNWHHLCVTWTQDDGAIGIYVDNSSSHKTGKASGVTFPGGGQLWIGNVPTFTNGSQFEGQMTYVNMWDKVIPTASIQNPANSYGTEAGNVLHWSFFAAMAHGDVKYSAYSSVFPIELYHWTFDESSAIESFDIIGHHRANITGARISPDRPSVVIEDQGHFVADNMNSDLSGDNGFTVSFLMKQTAMTSDILRDDFENLEVLRTAFPFFIRDNAMWKRCYSADQTSWSTADFHSNCDYKGPSLTVIQVGKYVFGGFVEQSWGGPAADIGNQHEGFLFSLSNPSNESPRFLPVQQNKMSAKTDPQFGPSFGQRDLELFQDDTGRLKGFSILGTSYNISNISLSLSEARKYFAGSQQFYPDKVEVFYYHVPSAPVGLESGTIENAQLTSSSTLSSIFYAHQARLNGPQIWCSNYTDPNSWLEVFLGKQYTLTHVAVQGQTDNHVGTVIVKYERTEDGVNWITYNKTVYGASVPKIVRVNRVAANDVVKEAFFPPFEAVKVRLEVGEGSKCMKLELYFYDAGCSQAYGVEDGTIPDDRLSTSSMISASNPNDWPTSGRLNSAPRAWGPYKHPQYGLEGNWFQVDLEEEKEVTCIATLGRPSPIQYTRKYEVSYSSNGHDWNFYRDSMGEKALSANTDPNMIVTNWLVPPINGRFIRLHPTECYKHCRLQMELYGNRNTSELISFGHGLYFKIRHGRYHIIFAKLSSVWEIHHPFIFNKWFEATLTWKADDGLKLYVNGNLMASDTSPTQLKEPYGSDDPFTLGVGSEKYGGDWGRSVAIDDVSVWSMAFSEDKIKRKLEVFLDFDDNSRNWTSFLANTNDWRLTNGCSVKEETGPCDDVSGGGRYISFEALRSSSDSEYTARFDIPLKFSSSYTCIKFYYHMWGVHVGRLNVYSKDLRGNEELLWRLFGNQNNTWKEARIPVDVSYLQYQVTFEAMKGFGYLGVIAIDQIAFTQEKCSLFPSFASPRSSGVAIGSSIVRMDSVYHQYLSRMLEEGGHGSSWWHPCYHAHLHNWSASSFHERCDNKGPTLTIARKDNYVFGGFTEQSWGVLDTHELYFEREDMRDLVQAHWSSPVQTLTASMWIKSSDKTPATLFTFGSVGSGEYMVQFSIQDATSTGYGITAGFCLWNSSGGQWSFKTHLTQNPLDGSWHHLAVVWQSSSNMWELHIDGAFIGERYKALWGSKYLITGGDLFIGQNLHPAKNSNQQDSFTGRATSFNMWDYRWERSEIALLAQSCGTKPGNIFQWDSIKYNLHGEVKLLQPSSCRAKSNYDLYFTRKDPYDYVEDHFSTSFSEFTVSLWMKSLTATPTILFAVGNRTTRFDFRIKDSGMPLLCVYFDPITGTNCSHIRILSSTVMDGFWHQLTVRWKSSEKKWTLHIDGIFQGEKIKSYFLLSLSHFGGDCIYPFPESIMETFSVVLTFQSVDEILWCDHSNETSSAERLHGSSTSYKSDSKAFIFSLNYTSQGALFKKEITETLSSSAIYSSPSTGPSFGEAPFDFQIGINGSMKNGSSHHTISYRKGKDIADSNLETVLAGAPNFDVSDVEVLYKGQGGSLCHQPCPYLYYCDERTGGCRCKQENDLPLMCELYKFYKGCLIFWPLELVENIEEMITHTWGQVKGGVQKVSGLRTDGVSGEIQLLDHAHLGGSCDTKFNFLDPSKDCGESFTSALTLKYWNRADGQRQVFLKTFGKFVVYQERNDSVIIRVERATKFCLKEIVMPEKIWSYLVFTFEKTSKILTVYRNGQKLDGFIRDEGCDNLGAPQFGSSTLSLGAGFGVFTQAEFSLLAIWKQVLSDETIADLSNRHTNFPFKVRVVVRITQQNWHDDLYTPGTMRYNAITNDITNNVTSFYSRYPGVNVSVTVNKYRPGSVESEFDIEYNVKNFSLFEELNDTISKTGHLNNMPLELIELTTDFVPSEPPQNLHATLVSDTSIDIAWQDPNLSPESWEFFQGYKVFVRPAGSVVDIITINAHQNFANLIGLKSLLTYDISVAAYTLAGVGKESDHITVNTTLDAPPANVSVTNVTTSCVTIKWDPLPSETIGGRFLAYEVSYRIDGQGSSSLSLGKHIVCSLTNEVQICDLRSFTTYKYSVRRRLFDKEGNASEDQYFTTLEKIPYFPPTGVKCHNTSSTSLMIQWDAPSNSSDSCIRGYKVLIKPRDNIPPKLNTIFVCNNSLNGSKENLNVYTEYEVLVAALSGAGYGNYSEPIYCFTDADVPQNGPTNITANNASSTSIYIQWGPVPKPLRLGEITHYVFNITEVLTGYTTVVMLEGDMLNTTVGNLSKYTEYSIRGAAVNSKGQSNFTIPTTIRTSEDAPDLPPANVTAYNTSSTSIMVEFQAHSPDQLNGIIRKFNFTYFKTNDINPTVWTYTVDQQHSRRRRASPTNISVFHSELTGLEEYTTFSIQVSIFTVKLGPYSKVVNASTDEGVPRAPPLQVTAFNSSSTSIMVTWQNLTESAVPGTLLGYILRYIRADDPNALNFTEVKHDLSTYKNITNLDLYTLYNISVAGFTRAGPGNFSRAQSWTDEGVPDGPPNNVTGISFSASSINLVWLPVTKELQNGVIRGYEAKIYNVGGYVDETTVHSPTLTAVFEGLATFSNYTLKVRAFTKYGFGPWSALVKTTTSAGAPNQTPMNATAQATSSTTIHVTWSPVSLLDVRFLQGYRIRYFPVSHPHLVMDTNTGKSDIQADLTGLRPFTTYNVRVAAFTSEAGNYTDPLYVRTWEGVPSAPPSNLGVAVFDSQSVLVFWLEVPSMHQNGIIQGYALKYWNANNGTSPVVTLGEYDFSYVLKPLQKATAYEIHIWAFTSVGPGSVGSVNAMTDEDVPSKPPRNIAAQNHTSLTSIPISWEPVPPQFLHGSLAGYRVTYQAVKIGDLPVDSDLPVISEDVGPAVTSMTLQNLEPLVVYRITVAARNIKGVGPEGVTSGETCRCRPHLTTNWRNYPPYVNLTSLNHTGVIIPYLLTQVIDQCCGWCQEHNRSRLDFRLNGNNQTAQQTTVEHLRENIGIQTDFSFPVIGYKLQDSYKGGLGYSPFVESAGVAFVVYTDNSGVTDVMFSALLACWPVVLIPLIMAYIAGVCIWMLDSQSNNEHFPGSFIHGTWEGIWWAFVSMTTVGYGDRCPAGHIGRVFAVGWVLTGLVVISITTGALTTALTTITESSETPIYGSKVGAIYGSPEYNLGVRRNAIMNRDKNYHTLEELSDALFNREVDGVLIDTYAGGTHKELFSKASFRVAQIIDYKTAYGVVIGGDSMRLRHCFHGYMRSHQADIFSWVEDLVEPITGSGVTDEQIAQEISTGLFDSETDLFRRTLLISSTCAVVAVVMGLCFEAVRRIRQRAKVEHEKSLSLHRKEKMIEEMRFIMADFFEHSTNTLSKMKAKYKKEVLKRAKHSSTGERIIESTFTVSSELKSKKGDDDISVISLEDEFNTGSKC